MLGNMPRALPSPPLSDCASSTSLNSPPYPLVRDNGGVKVGNGAKKRWTDRPLIDGLAVLDLDIANVEAREKGKDLVARAERVLALERIGTNTNPEHDGAADLLVSVSVDEETNNVDGRPSDPLGFQQVRTRGPTSFQTALSLWPNTPRACLSL
jgi:hypothetical protein